MHSNYAASRVPGMPNFGCITPTSVICDVLLFLKIHKHVFIYNRIEIMISFGNIANEFVACLSLINQYRKKACFPAHLSLYLKN